MIQAILLIYLVSQVKTVAERPMSLKTAEQRGLRQSHKETRYGMLQSGTLITTEAQEMVRLMLQAGTIPEHG